jgi:hypothetical protein
VVTAAVVGSNLDALQSTYIPKIPKDPTTGYNYVYGGATTSYVLGAQLERFDNTALTADSDKTTGFGTFNGLSANCLGTGLTAQPGGGSAGETCYDISN